MTFADLRTIDTADVYKGRRPAGRLTREGADIVFRYADDFGADPAAPALAWTIPKEPPEVRSSGESVPPFFAGLLPEEFGSTPWSRARERRRTTI